MMMTMMMMMMMMMMMLMMMMMMMMMIDHLNLGCINFVQFLLAHNQQSVCLLLELVDLDHLTRFPMNNPTDLNVHGIGIVNNKSHGSLFRFDLISPLVL